MFAEGSSLYTVCTKQTSVMDHQVTILLLEESLLVVDTLMRLFLLISRSPTLCLS